MAIAAAGSRLTATGAVIAICRRGRFLPKM
jgi:hypothetical protein